jgi:hypothetical protein
MSATGEMAGLLANDRHARFLQVKALWRRAGKSADVRGKAEIGCLVRV